MFCWRPPSTYNQFLEYRWGFLLFLEIEPVAVVLKTTSGKENLRRYIA